MKISNDEISLHLKRDSPADLTKNWLRTLHFNVIDNTTNNIAGEVSLRVGYTDSIVFYGGHIGYKIDKGFRGRHFAGQACILLKDEIKKLGLDVVWITCNPDNLASRKTCEWIGADFIEVVDLPEDSDMYNKNVTQKCRYRWIIY